MKFHITILLIALFFGACTDPKPQVQIQKKVKETLPTWFLTPQKNDSNFLYGVGSGVTFEDSTKSALDNLVSKLGISIESNYSSIQTIDKDFREYVYSQNITSIKSRVDKIIVSNYEVVDTKKIKYDNYISLVKSNKQKFISSLTHSIDKIFLSIKSEEKSLSNADILHKYHFYNNAKSKLSKIYYKLLVLNSVDDASDTSKYVNYIRYIDDKFNFIKNNINFYIVNTSNIKIFENLLKSYINNYFRVSNENVRTYNQLKIYISHNVEYSKSHDIIMADVLVTIYIRDNKNNTIKTKQTAIIGYSVKSKEDALKDASSKYYNQLNLFMLI